MTEASSQRYQTHAGSGSHPVSLPRSGSRGIAAGRTGGAASWAVDVPVAEVVARGVVDDGGTKNGRLLGSPAPAGVTVTVTGSVRTVS